MDRQPTHMPRRIESRQNAWVRELRSGLHQGDLTTQGHLAIEGAHLIEEARRSGLAVEALFLRDGSRISLKPGGNERTFVLSRAVFDSAASTMNPMGVAALVDPPQRALPNFSGSERRSRRLIVIAGGLQDPGNLGTLIRSAEAFGVDGMILLPSTVSCWNQKVLRASSGSAFRLPLWPMSADRAFAVLREGSIRVVAAVAHGGLSHGEMERELTGRVALLVGNEGAGLQPEWLRQADAKVTLDLPGVSESLNAAVAGSILLYEAARQRREMERDSLAGVENSHEPL